MAIKDFIQDVETDISDIFLRNFEITGVQSHRVPSDEDPDITFDYGKVKKAKEFETCVLHVDIRNSTQLNLTYDANLLSKLYSAFVKSAIRSIENHNGKVRTINGDRVMGVFPSGDCFSNALDAAVTINTITNSVLSKYFKQEKIKCGIGIDYGVMRIVKTGVRRGEDRNASKSLVWLGRPANVASKLADISNKPYFFFEATYIVNPQVSPFYRAFRESIFGSQFRGIDRPYEQKERITEAEFIQNISMKMEKSPLYRWHELKTFERLSEEMPSILMTGTVFDGFKKANPQRDSVIKNYWLEKPIQIKGYTGKVYGGNVYWTI